MTTTPENILDVLAENAVDGMLARLQWMVLSPRTINVVGHCREQLIARLREQYPMAQFTDGPADVLIANLTLPWLSDMTVQIERWRSQVQMQGLLMLTSFGPDTLKEWPDQHSCLVNRIDMHEVGDVLIQAGFADPVMEVEHYTIHYSDTDKMLRELNEAELVSTTDIDTTVATSQLTMELIYGHAWKVSEGVAMNAQGVATVPLDQLRALLRSRQG